MIARHWRGLAKPQRAADYEVVPAQAQAMVLEYDSRATHYEVAEWLAR
jgi:hypothetical protein